MKRIGRRARKRRALSRPRVAPVERATCPESADDWFQFDGFTLDTSLEELTASSLTAFERQVEGFPADHGSRSDFVAAGRQAMPTHTEDS